MAFQLRLYPNEALKPEDYYLQGMWKQSVYPMAERMDIDIILSCVSPQPYTHLAFEGYQYAKEKEYNDRMMRAFFQEEQDVYDVEVLTKLASKIGLDEKEYRESLETRKYRDMHQKALKYACKEAKITTVPTFCHWRNKSGWHSFQRKA